MKYFRFQNAFITTLAALFFLVFAFAACGDVKTLADNAGGNKASSRKFARRSRSDAERRAAGALSESLGQRLAQ